MSPWHSAAPSVAPVTVCMVILSTLMHQMHTPSPATTAKGTPPTPQTDTPSTAQ